jgi:predicted DNA-binding transcriptional regulator AlpA
MFTSVQEGIMTGLQEAPGDVWTIEDVRRHFKVSRTTIYEWMNEGLPSVKIQGVLRFDEGDVKRWWQSRKKSA